MRELAIRGVDADAGAAPLLPQRRARGPGDRLRGCGRRGLEGLELALDATLKGESAQIPGLKDALGRGWSYTGQMPDEPSTTGSAVVLTLDRFIQFSTERALRAGVLAARARAGMAVVIDPRSRRDPGAWPACRRLDPNRPDGAAVHGARLRPVTDPYEPGSTMKMFSVSAALDAHVVTPEDTFDCEHGELKIGTFTIHDSHQHDDLTVAEIVRSSRPTSAQRRSPRRWAASASRTTSTGSASASPPAIELPGERGGTLRPSARWGDVGLATVAFGQGVTATALQLTTAMASIAAGGVYHPPRLIKSIVGPHGEEQSMAPGEGTRVISEKAARQMTRIMVSVTEKGGTATLAALEGFEVAGKTGTAQMVDPHTGHYAKGMFMASFAGFLPAEEPRLAILVVLDQPLGDKHFGGDVAAPDLQADRRGIAALPGRDAPEAERRLGRARGNAGDCQRRCRRERPRRKTAATMAAKTKRSRPRRARRRCRTSRA